MRSSQSQACRFLWPWALGFVFLTLVPAALSLVVSTMRTEEHPDVQSWRWVGMEHYADALRVDRSHVPARDDPWHWRVLGGRPQDERFYASLYNSLFYTVLAVPLGLCSSLLVALLLNRPLRGGTLIRACIYLPHLLGGVATIVIWSWLLNPQFGWINQALSWLYAALDPLVRLFHARGTIDWPLPDWLYSKAWCKPAVVIMHVWTMGGSMLIFLAALRRVPPTLHDAAMIDGAGVWHRFKHVTWPQITPALMFNLIVSLIFTMQSFNESYLLQNRRQGDGLLFYVRYLYEVAFESPQRFGYASALAWILLVVLVLLVAPIVWTSRRWVYYEGES